MHAFLVRLRSNWMRNLLAALQVSVAVAAVTAVITNVLPALRMSGDSGGPALFSVRYGVKTGSGASWTGIFHADDVEYLMENAQSIAGASIEQISPFDVVRIGDDRYAVRGVGQVSPSYSQVVDVKMVAGGFFNAADNKGGSPLVAVISDQLADVLFGDTNPLGQNINLRPQEEKQLLMGYTNPYLDQQAVRSAQGTDVEIIGIFQSRNDASMQFGVSPHLLMPAQQEQQIPSFRALPSSSTLQGSGQAKVEVVSSVASVSAKTREITYSEILIKAHAGMEREAAEEVPALLRARLAGRAQTGNMWNGQSPDVLVEQVQDRTAAVRQSNLLGSMITGAMGLAALIVAGFAVFTTTMANLTQRTRAIGLARAIGATRGYIVREVIFEAALLAGVGGVIGALAAYPLGKYVLTPVQINFGEGGVSLLDLVAAGCLGVIIAMLVGSVAALYPAWTVARMMPAEAWREGRA